jgi:hypothetical protein
MRRGKYSEEHSDIKPTFSFEHFKSSLLWKTREKSSFSWKKVIDWKLDNIQWDFLNEKWQATRNGVKLNLILVFCSLKLRFYEEQAKTVLIKKVIRR